MQTQASFSLSPTEMEPKKGCLATRRRLIGWSIGATVVIVATALIVVLIFKTTELRISVTDASFSRFTFAPDDNNTLSYSLSLEFSLRNPNRRGGVLFDRVQVTAEYGETPFSAVNLTKSTPFYQGRRNTTVLRALLEGRKAAFKVEGDQGFERTRVYVIDVKLAVRVRVRQSGVLTRYFEPPEIECESLRVPLSGGGEEFRVVKCKNVYIFKTRARRKYVDSDHY